MMGYIEIKCDVTHNNFLKAENGEYGDTEPSGLFGRRLAYAHFDQDKEVLAEG